jgi:hypothetical protein
MRTACISGIILLKEAEAFAWAFLLPRNKSGALNAEITVFWSMITQFCDLLAEFSTRRFTLLNTRGTIIFVSTSRYEVLKKEVATC